MLPFRALIAFSASASFVISTNANPRGAIHDDMNLHHLSEGFEQPPKLLVRHLRTQISNKEVFHDVSPIGNCPIVGCSRAIGQEDEVERPTSPRLPFSPPQSHAALPFCKMQAG